MPQSELRLIRRIQEFVPIKEVELLPRGLRGIYVLYKYRRRNDAYDVVYVGMTWSGNRGGVRGRLMRHKKTKSTMWSHCSIFEVWDNIRDEEITELEGLFRQIYRYDQKANRLNKQGSFKKLQKIPDIFDERE